MGIDPAEVSIDQARERYAQMGRGGRVWRGGRGGGGGRGGRGPTFEAEFVVQDAFGQSIESIPVVRHVGFDPQGGSRWGGGGFDVVSMMFCLHYAFEDEEKTRRLLQNVAGALKKGGRLIGTIPNSDVLSAKVEKFHKQRALQGSNNSDSKSEPPDNTPDVASKALDTTLTKTPDATTSQPPPSTAAWGNTIYNVRFPGPTPTNGTFRPPFGWKYNYSLAEAVEAPEFVVPWEAFRA